MQPYLGQEIFLITLSEGVFSSPKHNPACICSVSKPKMFFYIYSDVVVDSSSVDGRVSRNSQGEKNFLGRVLQFGAVISLMEADRHLYIDETNLRTNACQKVRLQLVSVYVCNRIDS